MASQSVTKAGPLAGIFGEMVAEFFGTMILLLFGDGCVATYALFTTPGTNPSTNEWILVALGWGLAVMLGIYVAGAATGAHINPAVTLAMAVRHKLPWSKVIPYWVAQLLGAFIAALILFFVYHGAIMHAAGSQNIA
ncbi:MAG TPA: MIP/aquaporin family protein, partial [Ktedonobacteraceae bacterium]|nr:MIP/aquaporin family protein [Ktedonobacteraceae bacterium]